MRKPQHCLKCHNRIPYLWADGEASNTDNGLELHFVGSYGEFIDTAFEDGSYRVNLCHNCSHDLADWLGIDVRNWHTHKPGSGQHPDHHDEPED